MILSISKMTKTRTAVAVVKIRDGASNSARAIRSSARMYNTRRSVLIFAPLEEIVDRRVYTRYAHAFSYSDPDKGRRREEAGEATAKFPLSLLSPRRVKSFCHNGDKSDPLSLCPSLSLSGCLSFSPPPPPPSTPPEQCRRYARANAPAITLFM